jgi:hypothetical protein
VKDSIFKLLLYPLVAVLIMWISSLAMEGIMPTYGLALLELMLGQSLMLQQLNITANTTSIIEAISQGTKLSIDEYFSLFMDTLKHAIYQIIILIIVIIIIFIIIIWKVYKRPIDIRKNRP